MIIAGVYHAIRLRKYNLIIFVGIDTTRLNHFVSAISSDGKKLIEPFQFPNNADGFCLLASILNFFKKNSIIIVF